VQLALRRAPSVLKCGEVPTSTVTHESAAADKRIVRHRFADALAEPVSHYSGRGRRRWLPLHLGHRRL